MRKMIFRILMTISVAVVLSCGSGSVETPAQGQEVIVAEKVDADVLGRKDGDKIIIEKDVDLKGKECKIPAGKTLVFKGGIIRLWRDNLQSLNIVKYIAVSNIICIFAQKYIKQ